MEEAAGKFRVSRKKMEEEATAGKGHRVIRRIVVSIYVDLRLRSRSFIH